MKRLYILDDQGEREIVYSTLSLPEIETRLKDYELQHSSYQKFLSEYDCDSATFEESVVLSDWRNLLEEKERRQRRRAD